MKRDKQMSVPNEASPSLRRRRVLAVLASVPAISALGACERFIPGSGPPPTLYTLTPKSTFAADLPRVQWQLVLETPFAPATLNTVRIGIMPAPTIFEYYARSSWSDRAPLMVQTLMTESFENTGKIVSVGRESIGLRADFVLKTELREFQMEAFRDPPQVQVRIQAKLVKMPEREIVAASDFGAWEEANPDEMQQVIRAFDLALGKVLKGLIEWTLQSGEAAARQRAETSS